MIQGTSKKTSAKAAQQITSSRTMGKDARKLDAGGGNSVITSGESVHGNRADDIVSIGAATIIRGDITGKGDLVINGRVEGTVDLPDNHANLEETGYMQGGTVASSVNVRGQVHGDIEARRKVKIFATGTVIGSIMAPRVEIEDGAKFMGRIDMGPSPPAPAAKPKADSAKGSTATSR